jgi:hypothetical protein
MGRYRPFRPRPVSVVSGLVGGDGRHRETGTLH